MLELYAEIEGRIEQACEKLCQCSNPNISAVACESQRNGMGVSPGLQSTKSLPTPKDLLFVYISTV